jgi:hypothetical protein
LLLTEINLWNVHNKRMRQMGCGLLEVCMTNAKLPKEGAPRCARAVVDRMKQLALQGDLNFAEKWSTWARRRFENKHFPVELHACRRAWVLPLLDELDLFATQASGRVFGVHEAASNYDCAA